MWYPSPRRFHPAMLIAAALLAAACGEPAGPPPTLDPGAVSFDYAGPAGSATFDADGRCYWSPGYPAADSTCALALDQGDTILIRATVYPRTIKWQQVNLRFPADGTCADPDACAIALDYMNRAGAVLQSLRSIEAAVTIEEETERRIRGEFSGLLFRVGSEPWDTLRISGGRFDLPVER